MRLIKLFVVCLLALSTMPALAAVWVDVSRSNYSTTYIDETSITKDQDGLVRYFATIEYARPIEKPFVYTSNEGSIIANCLQGTRAIRQSTYFNGQDVAYVSKVAGDFETPTGAGLDLLNYACNKAGYGPDVFEKARSNTDQAVNDGKNDAKIYPSRDSAGNKLTALWTTFWAIGLSALLAYSLTKPFSFASPNTAHEQGMKWAAWLTMAIIIIRLSKYFITFDIEHLGMLVASLIFVIPIGYVSGFAYFKFRNRNKSFDLTEDNPVQEQVNEAAPIKTPAENKITSNDEAIDLARYKQAAEEIETGNRDDSLWYKAFAEGGGNENATKAAYIRLRVEQLRRAAVATSAERVTATQPSPAYTPVPQTANPKSKSTKTLYDMLCIPRDASDAQIFTGYQKQIAILSALENQDAEAKNKLIFIQHAKGVLLDPEKRAAYDAKI